MQHPLGSSRAKLFERHRAFKLHRRLSSIIVPRCEIRQAKGQRFDADAVKVGSSVGEGSFGQVFQVCVLP